jgi:glutamine synthetase
MLERLYSNKEQILKKSLEFFKNSNSLIPKIGCELEFFLLEGKSAASLKKVDDFILELQKSYQVQKERGESQIEIKTDFTANLYELCREIEDCKKHIQSLALKRDLSASFSAQPFLDDCGNALQFNISLHDENDKNLFLSDEDLIKSCANSLLSATDFMMIFLARDDEDYKRFSPELNLKLFKKGKFTAPINLSFGGDNRTCAIRVPKAGSQNGKRLEYRIASAGADPFLSIAAILISLTRKSEQRFAQIFGNAFDENYELENFCQNLDEAKQRFFCQENFIRRKFEEFLRH